MNVHIIGSGSSGNSFLYDDSILVDVGLPYKHLRDYAQQIKTVLFSHRHSDHFNKTSIRRLYIENKNIKFCCGDFLEQSLVDLGLEKNRIIVLKAGLKYKVDDVLFSPINLQHDLPNLGYRLMRGSYKILHATDTFSMDGITAKDYDAAVLEVNHELEAATAIIEEKRNAGEFCHLKRAIATHLSVEKAIDFVRANNIRKLLPVHIGGSTINSVRAELEASGLNIEKGMCGWRETETSESENNND